MPTAGTDGETIYYNPEYLEGLSVEEQTFIFAHEVCHIAFNHILRSEGKNPELWNIATDGVINQFLKRDGLKMAPGVVDMAEAINYDAEQLYEKLLQEKNNKVDKVIVNKINKVISNKVVVVVKVEIINNNLNHNKIMEKHKIKKVNSKVVMEDKVVIINNNLNHHSKVIQVVEVHKNKKNNHKNRVVVNLVKIHKKKINQNKMLGMILTVCGNKQ
ncbi:MAG: hypothetical protein L6V91_08705 [Bacilli bacterium]|nr:MAG: hypothetical protein L6V91_08705 [Bacilli bacterium]